MPSHKNQIVIAAAGGRKTTLIIEQALKHKGNKILITTYTRENIEQITEYIIANNGSIPSNITILTWFSFLLRDGVWPYQSYVLGDRRVESLDINTVSAPLVRGGPKNPNWYINKGNYIYKDRISEFVCYCNSLCGGLIINRLQTIYDYIFIDEMQDLGGWDNNFVESLMTSSINITLVGDPRQATYSTSHSLKNKSKKGRYMAKWVEEMLKKGLCEVKELTESFRCNQQICDFADRLYPDLPKTLSKNEHKTGHDGIFQISWDQLDGYVAQYKPKILRFWVKTNTHGLPAINIGNSKGKTFGRVLIFPTEPMKAYLASGDIGKAGDLSKLYVAVTRAKYSVTFVV